MAEKLTALVTPQDLICRVGGDEFVILVRSCTSRESLSRLAENIIEIAQTPFFHDGNECRFGTSVGIALHTGKIPRRPIVFANADLSLYAAKRDGRGTYKFFKPSMAAKNQVSLTQRKDLFDALTNGEIICHFQPQYSADTYDIVGAEALVRWESPKRGLMDATSFMPVAQQAGLNARVDEAMLELVLQAQDAWRARGIRYPQVSLNLSRERLYEASFRSHLESRINLEHRLSFELLETAFLDGLDGESLRNLDAIRDVGFSLELDDFGSGRSSVVALQSIAPDRVKIDRALTLPIVERPGQLLILDALSKIARLEQAEIVIEGMETDAHVSAIRAVDCDALQGFAFSYPLSFDDFTDLLEKQTQGGRTFPNLRRHG